MGKTKAGPKKWTAFILVGVGIFMSTLDSSIVNIAMPTLLRELDSSLEVVEWVMIIYLLTVSALLLSFGRLSDIKGRRWVYSRGLAVFSLGSLFCGLSPSAPLLIASRSFQGIGAAMIMACTQPIIIDSFPANERGKAMGTVGAVVAAGLTAGPALGGLILHYLSWQFIFYINIPIGIAVAVASDIAFRKTASDITRREKFDIKGSVLTVICFGSFLVLLTHIYKWGYTSPRIIILAAVWTVSTVALVLNEKKSPHPLFEPALLKIRRFILPLISAGVLFISLFTVIFLMPFYLMNPCGFSEKEAGIIMVTPFVFLFFVAPFSGWLSDRIGSRILCTAGMAILTASLFLLSRMPPFYSPVPIAWRLGLVGLGVAIFVAPNNSTVMSSVPPQHRGIAGGTLAMSRNLGMVMGVAFAATIFNVVFRMITGGQSLNVYRPELEPMFMTSFRTAMVAGVIVSVMGTVLAYLRGPDFSPKGVMKK